jgi:hypothetical protein
MMSFDIRLPNGRVFEARNRLRAVKPGPIDVIPGDEFRTTYSTDAHNIDGTVIPEGWREKRE